jgi:kynurenine 3-monooxygenase
VQKVHIVGAGLVGPLMAVYLARKGFAVELYERRPDIRRSAIPAGRSINLAVTARGLKALNEVGLMADVLKIAIPMKGRMLHDAAGKTSFLSYGQKEDEVIYAASRGLLNKVLLDAADAFPHVRISFNRHCVAYEDSTLVFADGERVKADVVIGADGIGSAVRKGIAALAGDFTISQSDLEYGYKELSIPPAGDGSFRMEKNALHIWPRGSYMMIALPNTDGSFTVTLFYPYEGFERLKTEESLLDFFRRDFPDALQLMPELAQDFFTNPTGALTTIKCFPWNDGGRAVVMGDAAHAIVPFFAQGMNSGFEDCAVLNSLITAGSPDWEAVFNDFSRLRKPNADAIADMAVENFIEMRDSVANPDFALRKQVGFELEKRWPDRFIPRYSMVIFHPEISYAEAKWRGEAQDRLLDELCAGLTSATQIDWQKAERLMASPLHPAQG